MLRLKTSKNLLKGRVAAPALQVDAAKPEREYSRRAHRPSIAELSTSRVTSRRTSLTKEEMAEERVRLQSLVEVLALLRPGNAEGQRLRG